MATVASPYIIRPMTIADIPQVSEIERESFPSMWPQTAYKRELQVNNMARYFVVSDGSSLAVPAQETISGTPPSLGGLVKGLRRRLGRESVPASPPPDERLAAVLGLWFMLEECHIVTVAVREALRRRGIGELLVITSIDLALERDQDVLTLECRVSNTGAQALYQKYGFTEAGLRKRYYTDNNEDALIMTTPPIRTPDFRARFEQLREAHQERWGAARIIGAQP
jgi:ribosomal-protein-alanine N-acetyltransferase